MSFPQDAAPSGMHFHVELAEDVMKGNGVTHTVFDLDEALDLAGAFIRFYEALYNATRERKDPPVHAEMTQGKDAITPTDGEVYFELTLFHPTDSGHNAVARVTPCDGELVPKTNMIAEVLSKLLGIDAENIVVVDRTQQDDEFPSPVIKYKGRGEGMSLN